MGDLKTAMKLGFFGATPVAQPSDVGSLADLTGGSVNTTLQDVTSGAFADAATTNDNFASLTAQINKLRNDVMQPLGLTA